MAGLVPAIHVFGGEIEGVDARDKPGHDEWSYFAPLCFACRLSHMPPSDSAPPIR